MAVMSRLLPLAAYSTFAILLLALLATPADALADGHHAHPVRGHDSIAKRRRDPVKRAKRCRPKTTTLASTSAAAATFSSPSPSPTPSTSKAKTSASSSQTTSSANAAPTTTSKAPTTTKAAATTTKTSTSAAAATSAYSGGSGSGSKKLLLAWPNGVTDLEKYKGDRVGGLYTWSPWCPSNAASVGPCYPMLWGTKQTADFQAQVKTDNCGLIFGFNEPNQADQANLSAAAGATLWNSLIKPLKAKGCKLVSPATTSATSGKQWIKDMLAACGGDCGFDYIALHWYGTSITEFKAYVDDWYSTFGKPLIISEYACQNFSGGAQCTTDETNTFHYTMGAWFDQHPGVAMYAPFGFMHDMYNVNYDNQLMASDGSPNALGSWYLWHETK